MKSGKERSALLRAMVGLCLVGAACMTRPVRTWNPDLKQSFTTTLATTRVDKIDLLFMIDNSASMGDKQALLAQAVPDMINRLVTPNCVDRTGVPIPNANVNNVCSSGTLEFPPVHDMHIGIVTSSLGQRAPEGVPPDQCDPARSNDADPSLPSHADDRGELVNRGGSQEIPVTNAQPFNFLAWFPPGTANAGQSAPPVPAETTVGDATTPGTLIGDFTSMISGVHEHGCGFEAQNEAWYRFLVQPDPFQTVTANGNIASLSGVDSVILTQRRAFLRPDSLLAVIVVTDENEEVANPLAIGGEGWLYEQSTWPDSPTYGAPEGTIECKSNPLDPKCTSCASSTVPHDANYAARCPADPPSTAAGYYNVQAPNDDDNVNVRFFHQRQRFGEFAGYPVSRYVRGLTRESVPDRGHEVDRAGNYVGDQDQYADCVNPIFAQDLPTDPNGDLCHLTRGPRTPDLVYYAAIAGVPHQLLQAKPGDAECSAGQARADCPQKDTLSEDDWLTITGKDPENYDFTGADPHMLESEEPRQTGCPPTGNDSCDPINGREWDTQRGDLQYACIFPLAQPKDCTQMAFKGACDCQDGTASENTPLCQNAGGVHTHVQINGKAYPSIREMLIAHAMADQPSVQGIVSSMCPIHTTEMGAGDPVFGYRPAVNAIVNRLKTDLEVQCVPEPLARDSSGNVPCLVLATLSKPGGEDACNGLPGLSIPTVDISDFRAAQHAVWIAGGGNDSTRLDPNTLPVCQMRQLSPSDPSLPTGTFDATGSCADATTPGWCYVEGEGAQGCPRQILFTKDEPPQGATVSMQCLELANGVVDGG